MSEPSYLSRRKLLQMGMLGGAGALLFGLSACGGDGEAGGDSTGGATGSAGGSASGSDKKVTEITLVHGVGANGAAITELANQFAKETGIKVNQIEFGDPDFGPKIQLVEKTGNASFDVALSIPADVFALTNSEGVYAPISTDNFDPKGLEGLKDADLIHDKFMVNQDVTALTVYSTTFKDNPPTTWADFFDLDKYPGYRGLQSAGFGVPINIEIALFADGVTADELYPLDLDRAFKKLDTIKDKVALWDNAPKALQDIEQGNTTMTFSYSPATLGALKKGENIGVGLFKDAPVARGVGALMQQGPHGPEAGQVFLDWWTKPEIQAKYAELCNYGIVLPSQSVYDLVDESDLQYAPFVPGQPQGHLLDFDYYTTVGDDGKSNLDHVVNGWNSWRAAV